MPKPARNFNTQRKELVSGHSQERPQNSKRMKDEYIRNREGKIVGRFDRDWLRDGTGKLLARYDKSDDRTRNASGKIVGDGDQRLRTLPPAK